MYVLATEEDDDTVATMTVSLADDDHKFDVWAEGDEALVEYQETLTYRGEIEVIDPDDEVYKSLMMSEQMTELLDKWDVASVRRAVPTP